MDWGTMLPIALGATAAAMTGGAAAPALAGVAGAAEGAGAAGLGAVTAAEAAGAAAAGGASAAGTGAATTGALEAGFGAGAGAGSAGAAQGAAAPSGWASIMEPMAGSTTPGLTGGTIAGQVPGMTGQGIAGSIQPGLSQAVPVPGMMPAPGMGGALGSGVTPGTPAALNATAPQAPGFNPQQANALNNMMNGQPQQQRSAPGGATPPARNDSNLKMSAVNTPDLGARPSLAQLLYGRR